MKWSSHLLVTSLVTLACCASNSLAGEIPSQTFSINNATVGVTTLTDVQRIYGKTEAIRVSQEDGADVRVCYVNSSPKGDSFLVFESGVMGSFKEITGFRISTLRPKGNCASTKVELNSLKTGNGIKLGLGLEDFKKAVPVEFEHRDSEFIYEAVTKRAATKEELNKLRARWPNEKQDYFDVTMTLRAKFKDNRLIDLYVHKIESY